MNSVKVLFFGATADIVGSREKEIDLDQALSTGDILEIVRTQHPALSTRKLLISLNQEFATGAETVSDGDEIAVFTPVSGG